MGYRFTIRLRRSNRLAARAHNRILKVAQTMADLEGCEQIQTAHIEEAIPYRTQM